MSAMRETINGISGAENRKQSENKLCASYVKCCRVYIEIISQLIKVMDSPEEKLINELHLHEVNFYHNM